MAENLGSIKDPSVSFKVTDKLKLFFKEHQKEMLNFREPAPSNISYIFSGENDVLKENDLDWLNSFLIHKRSEDLDESDRLTGHNLDVEICKLLTKKEFTQVSKKKLPERTFNLYLHELLDTSEFLLPKNEVIQRNPVLAARIEKLKKDQEEREYKAMTRNIDTSKVFMKDDTLAYQMNMMNRHLIAVGQFIVSVGAGFAFGFLGIELLTGELDFGFRLLLGISCALIIAIAEFYFLAKHLSNEEGEYGKNYGTFSRNSLMREKHHED